MYPGIDPNVMQQLLARLGPQQFQKPMLPQQMQQMPPAQTSRAPVPPSYLPIPQAVDTARPGMPPAPTPIPVTRPGHPNAFQNLAQTLGIRPPADAAGFEPPGMGAAQAVSPGLRVPPEMMGPQPAARPMIKPMPEAKPPEMKPPEPAPPVHDGAHFEPASVRIPTQLGPPEVSDGQRFDHRQTDEMPPGLRGGPRPAPPQLAIGAQPGNRARQVLGRPNRGLVRGQRPVGAAQDQSRPPQQSRPPHRKPMRRNARDTARLGGKLVRKLGHRVRPDAGGGHPAAAAVRSAFAQRVARRL